MRNRITFLINESINKYMERRKKALKLNTDKKYFIYLLEKDDYKISSKDL